MAKGTQSIRKLVVIFGDQLDPEAAWRDGFDAELDAIWMAEARYEAKYGWSTKQRIAVFLSAMRHFRDERRTEGVRVFYSDVEEEEAETLGEKLKGFLDVHRVEAIRMVEPGEWRIRRGVERIAGDRKIPLEVLRDRTFLTPPGYFEKWAMGRKELRMEYFYREMRKLENVLMDDGGKPVGGKWNYDSENRKAFGKSGPEDLPEPLHFEPDELTREVLAVVERVFGDHPGGIDTFRWPVTPADAEEALQDFIENRLPSFGDHQDAMWTGQTWLYHSLLSVGLNLKMLHPRKVILAAEAAWKSGRAPLAAVEGFIRQILGWREYVRGIYWREMPGYLELNALEAGEDLPEFFWTGKTEMVCLRETIGQTLEHGYAHHIQRLMVTGLFSLLYGVRPKAIHEWYLGVYVDAIEWVELPNVLGMSQYADGGLMASKPYAATGKYIQRMSNYCVECPYDPAARTGEKACPFTALYWDFLRRNRGRLKGNARMSLQLKNLDRVPESEWPEIEAVVRRVRGT